MSKDAINFLTNLKEEVNKYIADMDLEAVEKAADIIMDANHDLIQPMVYTILGYFLSSHSSQLS